MIYESTSTSDKMCCDSHFHRFGRAFIDLKIIRVVMIVQMRQPIIELIDNVLLSLRLLSAN